jgi:3-hydroxyacyl-CoA dehydrogenase
LGKVGVLVGVRPGFVANAMQAQRQRQANSLIVEGAEPQAVDRVLYDFGMPMGPFAMIDMAGLGIGWFPGKPAATVRDRLCEMGRLGQKAGAGFYDYGEDNKPRPSPVVAAAIEAFAAETGVTRRAVSDQEILERCLFASINEGARILQEGKAQRASDIDVAWVNGFGWPAWRGGPMHHADNLGLDVVLAGLKRYEGTVGPEFEPAPLIQTLAAEGRRFSDVEPKEPPP